MENERFGVLEKKEGGVDAGLEDRRTIARQASAVYGLLVSKGLLSVEDLDHDALQAHEAGRELADMLISRHNIPKRAISECLSSYYQCTCVEFDESFAIPKELLENLELDCLRKECWVPLWREGDTVLILIDDPRSSRKIEAIRRLWPDRAFRFDVGLRGDILRFLDSAASRRALEDQKQALLERMADKPSPPRAEPNSLLDKIADDVQAKLQNQHRLLQRASAVYAPLVEKGLMTRESLETAILAAHRTGEDVAQSLMSRHGVPKAAVGDCLSAFYKCPFVEFDEKFSIPSKLFGSINVNYLRANLWVPLWHEGSSLHVLVDDPHSSAKVQDIQQIFAGNNIRFYVGLRRDILAFIDSLAADAKAGAPARSISTILRQMTTELEPPREPAIDAEVDESDSAVVRLVNQIILDAARAGASDIHVEPYKDMETVIRFRVDGECVVYQKIPPRYRRALVSRIKIMAGLDISERRKPQDGKITFRACDGELELRAATLPTIGDNEDVVLRLLASGEPVGLDGLNLSEGNLRDLRFLLEMPYGIFLCVGPTGSGKTTTLHSCLKHLNCPGSKIWTAEDPVEITQYGLRQVQVQPKIGLSFGTAMRSFLRADPDVIMVGEMRDHETIEIAVQASLTGHLVLSTLHTNGAAETVSRLLDMGVDPFNYADALLGVLAQRLVRRLCEKCRRPYHPPRHEFDTLAQAFGAQALAESGIRFDDRFSLYEAPGCDACNHSGYKGRTGIHELLFVGDDARALIRTRAPSSEILKCALKRGMKTLAQDGILKCLKGETDYKQVRAVAMK